MAATAAAATTTAAAAAKDARGSFEPHLYFSICQNQRYRNIGILRRQFIFKQNLSAKADAEALNSGKVAIIVPCSMAKSVAEFIAAQSRYDNDVTLFRPYRLRYWRFGNAESSALQLRKIINKIKLHDTVIFAHRKRCTLAFLNDPLNKRNRRHLAADAVV